MLSKPGDFDTYDPSSLSEALERFGAVEVSAMEVYADIFKLGTGFIQKENEERGLHKANPIILGEFNGKIKRRIMFEDTFEETLREFQEADWAILNGLTYWGRENTSGRQSKLCSMIFDLDGITVRGLENYLNGSVFREEDFPYGFYPTPQYVVLSGNNIHLYFVFDDPISLYPNIKTQVKNLKYHLTDRFWNRYTSTIKDPQHQGINQGFRLIGGKTKNGGVVRAFRTSDVPATITLLNSFVSKENRVDLTKHYRENKYSLEEAKNRFPDWYQKVVLDKQTTPRHAWPVKIDLYNWWLRKMKEEVTVGHRYFSLMVLAIFAVKCGITDRERVKQDMESIIPTFREQDKPGEKPFGTDSEIENALECFDLRYITFPRKDIEKISGVFMPANKRNGRRQEVHLAGARSVQAINDEFNGTCWRNKNGAPKKAMLVWDCKIKNPELNNSEIARKLGISRPTVSKWLKVENWREQYGMMRLAAMGMRFMTREEMKEELALAHGMKV